MEIMHSIYPAQSPHADVLAALKDIQPNEYDKYLHRAKPKHPTHKPEFPWVWQFVYAEGTTAEFRANIAKLMEIRIEGISIQPHRTQDRPGSKFLSDWVKNKNA